MVGLDIPGRCWDEQSWTRLFVVGIYVLVQRQALAGRTFLNKVSGVPRADIRMYVLTFSGRHPGEGSGVAGAAVPGLGWIFYGADVFAWGLVLLGLTFRCGRAHSLLGQCPGRVH